MALEQSGEIAPPEAAGVTVRRPPSWSAAGTTLAVGLFPTEAPSARSRRAALPAYVAWVCLAALVSYARLSASDARSIWAEDGSVFLSQQLHLGWPRAMITPYAGYMHLLPRTVAAAVSALPLVHAAAAFAASACLIVGLCAVATYRLSQGHLTSRLVRLGLAGAVVLLPVAGLETAGNVANSHWFLVAAAFWAILARPDGRLSQVLAIVLIVLAVGSDPLALLFLPLVLLRLIALRGLRAHAVSFAFLITAAVQLAVVLGSTRVAREPVGLGTVLLAYPARVCLVLIAGIEPSARLSDALGAGPAAVALCLFLGLGVLAVLVQRQRWWIVVVACGYSVAFWAVPARLSWLSGMDPYGPRGLQVEASARYLDVPMLLVLVVVAVVAQELAARASPRVAAAAVLLALCVALPAVLAGFRAEPDVRRGPAWAGATFVAAAHCKAHPTLAMIDIQLAPARAGWRAWVPCARLK